MSRREAQQRLQQQGMSRAEARRVLYGKTWKQATAPGRGVQRAITKAERLRREAMKEAIRGYQESNDEGQGQEASDLREGRVAPLVGSAAGSEDSSGQDGVSQGGELRPEGQEASEHGDRHAGRWASHRRTQPKG